MTKNIFMIPFWSILILLILVVAILFTLLRFQASQVTKRENLLRNSLWERNIRIPLLLEVLTRAGMELKQREEIISLRAKASSPAYLPTERIDFEKGLSKNLAELFRQADQAPILKSGILYLSLKKEFFDCLEAIRHAINDYNYELEKWRQYVSRPWFKIFEFCFEIRKNKPSGLI